MVTLLVIPVCGAHAQGRGSADKSPLMFSPHDKPRGQRLCLQLHRQEHGAPRGTVPGPGLDLSGGAGLERGDAALHQAWPTEASCGP